MLSSSSRQCRHVFDCLFERLQLMSHEAIAFTKQRPFCTLFKRTRRRNKRVCMREDNKLHLVLDLDHTLVHSIMVSKLSQEEKYLLEEADLRADLWRFNEGHPNEKFIKLRPFVREFLEKANKLFSMHVYTMGSSEYAQMVLSLIDPDKVYFGDRVITRKESPDKKTLDFLVADKQRVIIVDDTSRVWPDHKPNLLQITKYIYFRDKYNSKSYADEKKDESCSNGSLANIFNIPQKNSQKIRRGEDRL